MTVIVEVKDKIWDIFSMTIVRRGVKYCCFLITRRSSHNGSKTFFCWICMFPTEVNAFILVQQHGGSRHIEFCKFDCTTWKLTLRDIKRHRKNPKQSGVVAVDSCFAILGAHQSCATNREALLKNTRTNSDTYRITPYYVSQRGQESKCRVDVSRRIKYRIDKTNL